MLRRPSWTRSLPPGRAAFCFLLSLCFLLQNAEPGTIPQPTLCERSDRKSQWCEKSMNQITSMTAQNNTVLAKDTQATAKEALQAVENYTRHIPALLQLHPSDTKLAQVSLQGVCYVQTHQTLQLAPVLLGHSAPRHPHL